MGPGLLQRAPPPVLALLGRVPVTRPGDVEDGPVTQPEQVRGSLPRGGGLVHVDHRLSRQAGDPTRAGDDREVGEQGRRRTGRQVAGHLDDQTLDPAVQQALHALADRAGPEIGDGGQGDGVAVPAGRLVDAEQPAGRAAQGRADHEHADGVGPLAGQRPGGHVRPVAQLLDRRVDLVAHVRTDVRGVVDDPGDGLLGDAGALGHVDHDHPPSGGTHRGHAVSPFDVSVLTA